MLPITLRNMENIREECKAMVNKSAIVSSAASLVPILRMDIAADVGRLNGTAACHQQKIRAGKRAD